MNKSESLHAPKKVVSFGRQVFSVVALVVSSLILINLIDWDTSSTSTTKRPIVGVANAHYAQLKDLNSARAFVMKLPNACQRSDASARPDGTVVIHVRCTGKEDMDGLIEIKNGIVKKLR